MFSRFTCILSTCTEMETFLEYELAPQLPSFILDGQIRKTTKSALGSMLKSLINYQTTIANEAVFVINGGYFLHTVVEPKPATYQNEREAYKASTKSAEQNRRAKNCTSVDIVAAPYTTPQNDFYRNNCNKTCFIQTLSPELCSAGITVRRAESDADILLCQQQFRWQNQTVISQWWLLGQILMSWSRP